MKGKLFSIIISAVPVGLFTALSNHDISKIYAQKPILHLKQVQVITRHGARTTVTNIAGVNDFPNYEEANWDVGIFGNILDKIDVPYILKVEKGQYQESSCLLYTSPSPRDS